MYTILIGAIILIVVGISELILSLKWNKFYFSHGLKFYSKEIEFSDLNLTLARIKSFINNIDNTNGFSKYTGEELDENTFAFRKKLITISVFRNDFENIHGIISIDSETRILKIKGYAHNSFLAFLLYIAIFIISGSTSFLSGIFSCLPLILIFGSISYAFDHRKSKKLAERITEIVNE